jgi:hypothetical protein
MTAADWLKFLPGWLAFAWTLGLGSRKVWLRRHRLALGPDDTELREALRKARQTFREIEAEGRRKDWFEERREEVQALIDLSQRRSDVNLRMFLVEVIEAWVDAQQLAPEAARPRMRWTGHQTTARERSHSEREKELFRQQCEKASFGRDRVEWALGRLNDLEYRTFGRS